MVAASGLPRIERSGRAWSAHVTLADAVRLLQLLTEAATTLLQLRLSQVSLQWSGRYSCV